MPPTMLQATITYDHPERGPEERLITPGHIMLGQSSWHKDENGGGAYWILVAFDHDKRGQRHFPMTRVSNWRSGDQRTSADA